MVEAMRALPDSAVNQEMDSSFKTIKDTACHVWGAEDMWLQRLSLSENPVWVVKGFEGSFGEALTNWQAASKDIMGFVARQDEASLSAGLHYSDLKGNRHTTPVYMVLQHVFNHATYHRGQLVTMMRTAGATQIPGTDFILFARENS